VSVVADTDRRLRRAELERFADKARAAVGLRGEVNILLTSSAKIRDLNRRFRKKDQATDVLSFPAAASSGVAACSGDLAVSVDIAAQWAENLRHSLVKELSILILHGMLHLAGYDHETDSGEMARKEATLRKRFELPASLTERARSVPGKMPRTRRTR